MALEIKAIPTLKGKEAARFIKAADEAYKRRGRIDFSKEIAEARAILRKAKMVD
jgi:hypothetical protein